MVFAGFLSGPQHHVHAVKLISWNINGVRTKLEKTLCSGLFDEI